ncbi:hypothetical protein ACFSTC_32430 [Nonomuraea ferruginea]
MDNPAADRPQPVRGRRSSAGRRSCRRPALTAWGDARFDGDDRGVVHAGDLSCGADPGGQHPVRAPDLTK